MLSLLSHVGTFTINCHLSLLGLPSPCFPWFPFLSQQTCSPHPPSPFQRWPPFNLDSPDNIASLLCSCFLHFITLNSLLITIRIPCPPHDWSLKNHCIAMQPASGNLPFWNLTIPLRSGKERKSLHLYSLNPLLTRLCPLLTQRKRCTAEIQRENKEFKFCFHFQRLIAEVIREFKKFPGMKWMV